MKGEGRKVMFSTKTSNSDLQCTYSSLSIWTLKRTLSLHAYISLPHCNSVHNFKIRPSYCHKCPFKQGGIYLTPFTIALRNHTKIVNNNNNNNNSPRTQSPATSCWGLTGCTGCWGVAACGLVTTHPVASCYQRDPERIPWMPATAGLEPAPPPGQWTARRELWGRTWLTLVCCQRAVWRCYPGRSKRCVVRVLFEEPGM